MRLVIVVIVFIEQGLHERCGIFSTILCTVTKLGLQEIASQTIVAKERMISNRRVMYVVSFAFLIAEESEESGVQIKENLPIMSSSKSLISRTFFASEAVGIPTDEARLQIVSCIKCGK
jgi:hypothetical protein